MLPPKRHIVMVLCVSSKSFTLCFYIKTIRTKLAKVQFAYFVQRGQRGIIAKDLTQSSILMWRFRCSCRRSFLNSLIGSLSNHDDYGNKNPTNLHIRHWKTVILHALHVHFSSFDILKTFSFFLHRELTRRRRRWQKRHKLSHCTIKNSGFARFTRAFFIFVHFAAALVLSMTWMTCFAVLWTTWVHDDKFSILSCYVQNRWYQFNSGILRILCASIMPWNNWDIIREMRSYIFRYCS